ncbi:hypothetical protein [Actinomadura sp. NTSP31]
MIDVQDRAPHTVAAELIESIRNTDPKSAAEMIDEGQTLKGRLPYI